MANAESPGQERDGKEQIACHRCANLESQPGPKRIFDTKDRNDRKVAVAVGGVMAEHLGWFYYFLIAGSLISVACFVLYRLFDTVEALVEIRDIDEAGKLDSLAADTASPHTAAPGTSIS